MLNTTSRCIKSLHFDSVSESAFLFQRQWSLSTFSTWQSWSSAKWCQVATELGCSKWIVPLSLASDILHFLFAFSTSRRAAKLIGDMPEEFRLFIFFQSFLRCFPMFHSVFLFVCLLLSTCDSICQRNCKNQLGQHLALSWPSWLTFSPSANRPLRRTHTHTPIMSNYHVSFLFKCRQFCLFDLIACNQLSQEKMDHTKLAMYGIICTQYAFLVLRFWTS